MASDPKDLQRQIDRLTAENVKLRSQLAVTRLWNPPPELEHALQDVHGWQCVSLPPAEDNATPTLILIAGTTPGAEPQDAEAAGQVWRYLLTAAPASGRIGPFARASMPDRLLGYLGERDGRPVIVLNTDLTRGRLARAAHMLRAGAKSRRPRLRLQGISAVPLLGLCGLLREGGTRSLLAAAVPTAVVMTSVAVVPSDVPARVRPAPPPLSASWDRDQLGRAGSGPSPAGAPQACRPSGTPALAPQADHSTAPTWTPSPRAPASPAPAESPTPSITSSPPFRLPPLITPPTFRVEVPSQTGPPASQGP